MALLRLRLGLALLCAAWALLAVAAAVPAGAAAATATATAAAAATATATTTAAQSDSDSGALLREERAAVAALQEEQEEQAVAAGRRRVAAALALWEPSPDGVGNVLAALEALAWDARLPAAVRGSALAELAVAHEDAFPSFATRRLIGRTRSGFSYTSAPNAILDRSRAVALYREAAALGNETAQFRMGTLFATGALGVKKNPVEMMLHYYFASLAGHEGALLALGFRHNLGLGVPQDCKAAVLYYELAAEAAVRRFEADGVGPLNERERLSVDNKARSYMGRRGSAAGEDEEVVDYYKHAAEKGDVSALVALGQIHFYGARGVERDLALAAGYFRSAAASGDPLAQTSLGHMLVKGMGVAQDLRGAFRNFTSAAEAGSAAGMNGLGYMHLYGLHVAQDAKMAHTYFNEAAEQGNPEAYYNLGALHVSGVGVRRRSYPTAINYFSLAVQKGHTLAMHKLALINLHGIGKPKSCDSALQLFKVVAERGEAVRLLARGHSFWDSDDVNDSALQVYLVAAELGYEVAQSNAAFLLDEGADIRGGAPPEAPKALEASSEASEAYSSSSSSPSTSAAEGGAESSPERAREGVAEKGEGGAEVPGPVASKTGGKEEGEEDVEPPEGADTADGAEQWPAALWAAADALLGAAVGSRDALRLYELAAEQGNVEARLKIGDFYYYGLGDMPDPDFKRAAFHYKLAQDKSAQAMFNLGFMYQHGIGLERDFHLAKRLYDTAELTHMDAKVPVSLALSGLWAHRVYRALLHNERSSDMPDTVNAIAKFLHAWFGTGGDADDGDEELDADADAGHDAGHGEDAGAGAGAGAAAAGKSKSAGDAKGDAKGAWARVDDAVAAVQELEDDTIVAMCLFVLLVGVLVLRNREQQRRRPHEHQD